MGMFSKTSYCTYHICGSNQRNVPNDISTQNSRSRPLAWKICREKNTVPIASISAWLRSPKEARVCRLVTVVETSTCTHRNTPPAIYQFRARTRFIAGIVLWFGIFQALRSVISRCTMARLAHAPPFATTFGA